MNPAPKRILITGATGFVGSRLCEAAAEHGFEPRRALRAASGGAGVVVGEVGPNADWTEALAGVDAVVHLAARVHVMRESADRPQEAFRRINVAGTERLARQAASAGVRRLVFLSSIKVNGESTEPGRPYTAGDAPAPADPYGISKHEADARLRRIAAETGLEVVIIRPPLVYGPGVKANFRNMMLWLSRGVPLPFGAIHNQRSLVALDNLVDLIMTCMVHPAAANQTFLAGDGEDLSTTDLLRRLGAALGRPARLVPVPAGVLEAGAALLGKRAVARRLLGSLQVDISKTRELLDWTPPVTVDEALRKTAAHFLAAKAEGRWS